jgi:hypothetical protein
MTVKLPIDYCPIGSLMPDQRGKLGEENRELQMDLTGDVGTPQFAVVDARGNLIAMRGGFCEPWELISFLKAAASSHRLRTSPARLQTGYVWAVGSVGIAVICLIAVWTLMREQ